MRCSSMSSVVNIGELKKIAEHNPREYIKRFMIWMRLPLRA